MAANRTKYSNANKNAQGYGKYMSCQQYKSISMHYYPLSTPSFIAIPPNVTNPKQRKIQPINIDFNNEKKTHEKINKNARKKQTIFYAIKQKERSNVRINKQGLNPVTSHALPFPLGKQNEEHMHIPTATVYRCTQVVVSYTLVRCPVEKDSCFPLKHKTLTHSQGYNGNATSTALIRCTVSPFQ